MGDKTEFENSIQQYQTQLKQVEEALNIANDATEQQSLLSLRNDLKELIKLTVEAVNTVGNVFEHDDGSTSCHSSIDDEMALFVSEIKNLEATASSANSCKCDDTLDKKLQAIKDELQAMIGKKCSAPHNHTWGTKAYHNAIICAIDDSRDYDLADIKDFKLRILFTNPTHKEMVPCSYFLDGDCKFDESRCNFSHGELIPFGELKDYQEPDFTQLKRNCVVLAKLHDRIWHKGRVLCVNFIEKSCRVKLDHQKKDIDCEFEDLFPIYHDEDLSSGSSDSDSNDDDNDDDDSVDIQEATKAHLIQQSLFNPAPDRKLGEWEKHTKGIGSKLMQKMGYIIGTGLGTNGKGIIVPISAQILPPGRSLDHCMELREAANGDKDLFNVERKLKREQKKQEVLNVKAYERESNKTDIFSFLNDNILTNDSPKMLPNVKSGHNRQDYKNHSNKNLNVESVKIADDIRKKQKEIIKVKESMKRHSIGSDMYKRLQSQLNMKTNELNGLKKSETFLAKEQLSRRHKDKLSVF